MPRYLSECVCRAIRRAGLPCGHQWRPRIPGRPPRCPKCGSVHWDRQPAPATAGQGEKETP